MDFIMYFDSSRSGMLRWKVSTLNTTLCPPIENLRSVAPQPLISNPPLQWIYLGGDLSRRYTEF
ncbi:hypothetical protein BDV33DRAFT_171099 [Aspergillus novoparasiticus]|uniref:Uncharacterized protein n=1 Tax=Aspergillus novoparasiticus TaxID=986946 RepID=A0A5N6EV09_9EURO|nr:hypothetical protein BDV33DRAFT_171099 [Aspergillus novoparasiticus]